MWCFSRQDGAGGLEENQRAWGWKMPKANISMMFCGNCRKQNHNQSADLELCSVEEEQLEEQWEEQGEELLEKVSRRLIMREGQLFNQDCPCKEEKEQLQKDLEALMEQIWSVVKNTFSSSSSEQIEVLKSAVVSIQQQEVQDQYWAGCSEDAVPEWRPQKCLSTHMALLQNMVESRLTQAAEDNSNEANELSSPVKREVCRMGQCVNEDLLTVVRKVKDCYPPHMDILNIYAGLYHQRFSARLNELAASGLETDECSYLLLWVNHYYPHDILKHKELDGRIKTTCLGSLLLLHHLNQLEEQYLTHKENNVELWLTKAISREEESWLSGRKPELIDSYYFSPLAIDVIEVIDGSLTEFTYVIRDQRKAERITAHLENFLSSYKKRLKEFVNRDHSNVHPVIKAHLACEEQLRDYITEQEGPLSEQQRHRCLGVLSALRDFGYQCLTSPIHDQLKSFYHQLWTSAWLDGSPPVVNLLLDSLNQQLTNLTDLKPACRQSLLDVLHQDVVVQYMRRMMKTRLKSNEQQVCGAQRLIEDTQMIHHFFSNRDCSSSSWLGEMLQRVAEILRLQDPESVQLELVSLARMFPDLSEDHVSALLSLKIGLSAANIRSIRRSVEENRLHDVNHSPVFFSRVKVKWINKINYIVLKT